MAATTSSCARRNGDGRTDRLVTRIALALHGDGNELKDVHDVVDVIGDLFNKYHDL
jgi:hypothetical protein